jgi:hypothetical protein
MQMGFTLPDEVLNVIADRAAGLHLGHRGYEAREAVR